MEFKYLLLFALLAIPIASAADGQISDIRGKAYGFHNDCMSSIDKEGQNRSDINKSQLQNCRFGAGKIVAEARVDKLERQVSSYQDKIDKFADSGLDISALQSVVDGAKTQVIDPLKAAINSATDFASLKAALKGYCLFDGCKDGANYHLEAKFEVQRLFAVLDNLENKTNVSTAKIAEAKGYLNNAQDVLDEVGTSQYTKDQKQTISSNVKSAVKAIRDINKGLPKDNKIRPVPKGRMK
ncbi:MAG: hypothetical protein AABX38_00550 [Candidatus Micrarchaeota archaeon]